MQIDRPIFIVSPPRCGTSLLYRCIGEHPDVGYLSRANKKLPEHPRLAYLLTRLGIFSDTKRESRAIWDRFTPGRGDVLGAEDATDEMRDWYRRLIGRVLKVRGASRFVAKLPAFAVRVPWLAALFPDALFVWILRDWRPVVSSTARKGQRDFGGETFGVKPEGWEEVEDRSPEMRAAWQLRESFLRLEAQAAERPGRFLMPWYEDLCADPVGVMAEVARFAGLRWDPEAGDSVPDEVRPPSTSWRSHLDPATIDRIRESYGDVLARYEHPSTDRVESA